MPRKAKKADVFDPTEEVMPVTKSTRSAATRSKKAVKSSQAETPPNEPEVDAEPHTAPKRQTRAGKQTSKAAAKPKATRTTRTTRKAAESIELPDDDVASTAPASPAKTASPVATVPVDEEPVKAKKGRRPRAATKAKKTTGRKATSAASTAPSSPSITQPSHDASIETLDGEEQTSKEVGQAPEEPPAASTEQALTSLEETAAPEEAAAPEETAEASRDAPMEEEVPTVVPTDSAPVEREEDAMEVEAAAAPTEIPPEPIASGPPASVSEAGLLRLDGYVAAEHDVYFSEWSSEEQVTLNEMALRELAERKRTLQEAASLANAADVSKEGEMAARQEQEDADAQHKTPIASSLRSERKSRQKASVPSIQTSQRGTRAHLPSALTTPVQQISDARAKKGSQRRPAQPIAGPPPPLLPTAPAKDPLEAEAVPLVPITRRPLAEKPTESSRLPTAIPVRKALVPKPVDPPVPPPKVPQRSSVPEAQAVEKAVPPPLLAAPSKLTLASPLIKHKKKKRSSSASRQTEEVPAKVDARESVLPDYVMRPSMAHTLMYTPPTVDRHNKQARREEADPIETPAPRRTSLVQPPQRPIAIARTSLQEEKETREPSLPTSENTTRPIGEAVQDLLNFEHELAATMAEINGSLLPSPIHALHRTQAHKPPITTPLKTVVTMGDEEEDAPPAKAALPERDASSISTTAVTEPPKPSKPASTVKPSVTKPTMAQKPLHRTEFKKPEVKRPLEASHLPKPSTKVAPSSSHAATAATEAASRHELAALRRQQQEEARLANLRQKQEEREKKRLEAKRKEEEAKHKKPFSKENRGGQANQHGPPAATGVKRKVDAEEAEATKVPESAQKKIKAVTPKAKSAPEEAKRPEEIRKSIEQLERDLKDQKKKLRASLQETTDLSSYELTATGTPNGLARIESDDSDGELSSLQNRKRTGPTWAQTPALKQSLMAQQSQDPDTLLGDIPIPPLDLETIFGRKTNRYRARTSSAHWTGTDQLTKDEQVHYQTMMGFRP